MRDSEFVASFVSSCFDLHSAAAYKVLESEGENHASLLPRLIRVGANCPGHSNLFYGQLFNLWKKKGFPSLKPVEIRVNAILISDFTIEALSDNIKLFSAARGVKVDLSSSSYDSVEMDVMNPNSSIYAGSHDLAIVVLSEHWLNKYLGSDVIVENERLATAEGVIVSLIEYLLSKFRGNVVFANFPESAYPMVCNHLSGNYGFGRGKALEKLNETISKYSSPRFNVSDVRTALFLAGGAKAVGRRSYFFAKFGYEPNGSVAVALELATTVADLYGQTHRLMALDWDNTLWGGEIAELGPHEIVCGFDTPQASGFQFLQKYFRGVRKSGVLLAAVSRNDPRVSDTIAENLDIKIEKKDFVSLQINFAPKSELVARVSEDVNFGSEYILFIDDSDFELSEVLMNHEFIDILRAESPEMTLERFTTARFFNRALLQPEDLEKSEVFSSLVAQKEARTSWKSNEEFLDQINIQLKFSRYGPESKSRVLQLIKKSNQFNLTTRRHGETDIETLVANKADVWAIEYSDDFGDQGIISLVIIVPDQDRLKIDTWIMSCRVLNRSVEEGVFDWISKRYKGRTLEGVYIPTAKNVLVENHYRKLGFKNIGDGHWETLCGGTDAVHFVKKFIES